MAKFHTLKIADVRRETADCVSVAFDVPASLKEEYKYIQGQYLTLKLFVKGEELRRAYSLCSSPVADPEIRIAIKKVKDGKGSSFINDQLKAGDSIDVMTPMGNFYSNLSSANSKKYILFAGGSGITPMLSIIKTALHSEPSGSIQLFYGNRDEESAIFKTILEELSAKNPARFTIHHIFEIPKTEKEDLYKGMLSEEKIKTLLEKHVKSNPENEYFICGPGPMMENAKNVLQEMKVNKDRIHIEYFTAVTETENKKDEKPTVAGSIIKSHVTVIMDGRETEFELSSNGKVILDAALDVGVDVPYACKGAVCCTCRAKLLEGKVRMEHNYALTDNEVKDGFILTCQSHPLTAKVIVDYDV